MTSRGWLTGAVLGGLALAWFDVGLAHAGAVPPTKLPPDLTLDISSPVTVSLYQRDSDLPTTVNLQSPSRCITTGTQNYRDVTDCWLPELGKPVYVVVNGSPASPLVTLVDPAAGVSFPLAAGTPNPFVAALTTSAYPGQCTNVGSGTEADFTFVPNPPELPGSYKLTPTDCGGMAVIRVQAGTQTYTFILPRDGTPDVAANGIPEVWENLYGGRLDPGGDGDTGPAATSPTGDGLSTFDEYRGFIVSGKQIRTNPSQKDLFLHVVNPGDTIANVPVTSLSCGTSCYGGGTNTYPVPFSTNATLTVPTCSPSALPCPVGATVTFTASSGVFTTAHVLGQIIGTAGGRATIVEVTGVDASHPTSTSATAQITQAFTAAGSLPASSWQLRESLFALAYGSIPPERLHVLGYAPGSTNSPQTSEWVDKFNSLVPAQTLNICIGCSPSDAANDRVVNPNRIYGISTQKGIRVMEGLNTNSSSVLGWSFGVASPNLAGNVVVFTQRIINYLDSLMPAGTTTLKYSTSSLVNGAWTWTTPATVVQGVPVNRDFILSKAFQFYTGHEIHHSLDLLPDVQTAGKVSYGNHYAPGTGDCMDQAITTTSKSGTVTFYIPAACGTPDLTQYLIK